MCYHKKGGLRVNETDSYGVSSRYFDSRLSKAGLRQRHRELLTLLQIKDNLAEFTPHVFRKLSDGVPSLRVEYGRLHLDSVSDVEHGCREGLNTGALRF